MKFTVRKHLNKLIFIVIIIIISYVLRIPTHKGPLFTDSWYLIWESRLFFSSYVTKLIIHPFSLLGAYPFSPYPIGSLFIYGVIDIICFHNEILAVNVFVILWLIISAYASFTFFNSYLKNQ